MYPLLHLQVNDPTEFVHEAAPAPQKPFALHSLTSVDVQRYFAISFWLVSHACFLTCITLHRNIHISRYRKHVRQQKTRTYAFFRFAVDLVTTFALATERPHRVSARGCSSTTEIFRGTFVDICAFKRYATIIHNKEDNTRARMLCLAHPFIDKTAQTFAALCSVVDIPSWTVTT